jgi:hypothetical protein
VRLLLAHGANPNVRKARPQSPPARPAPLL